ncbi:MAG: hypothetical protein JO165_03755 [Candidatus Eremiobacteraeota bacterium]|nr:hypothetical protein [Candidatus Eremiobacteraeota bacterium]
MYLHEGGRDELNRVVAPFADDASFFEEVMEFRTYRQDAPVELDGLTVRFARTRHYIEAYAMRVESGTTAMTYSADTAPDESVVDLARDGDIFLCEAALGADGRDHEPRGHSNAHEAGGMAESAGVKHLVITHYDAQADPKLMAAAARTQFGGTVSIADDGVTFVS